MTTLEEDDKTSAVEMHALLFEAAVSVSILNYNPIYSAGTIDACMHNKMLHIICDKTYVASYRV